jgi:hypothetical protein
MNKLAFVIVSVSVLGCSSETSFKIKNASCSEDFTSWYPGLSGHILRGSGDGAFDYDPSGEVVERLNGDYSLESGDFSWDVVYHPDHFLVSSQVIGYGYAKGNGDLDVVGSETKTDVVDQTWTVEFRTIREGCDVDNRRRFMSDGETYERVERGSFESSGYTFTRTTEFDTYTETQTGTIAQDLTFARETLIDIEGYYSSSTETGDLGNGTTMESFLQEVQDDGQTITYEGEIDSELDGSRQVKYDIKVPGENTATWDYLIDYYGDGGGTYTSGSTQCDIEFRSGDCFYDCGGGSSGECN